MRPTTGSVSYTHLDVYKRQHSESTIVKRVSSRKLVGDTDVGKQLKTKIKDLEMLLEAYHTGAIVERFPVR